MKLRTTLAWVALGGALATGILGAERWEHASQPPPGPADCWELGSGVTFEATGPAGTQCPDPDQWAGPVPGLPYALGTQQLGLGLDASSAICDAVALGLRWQVWATSGTGAGQQLCALLHGTAPPQVFTEGQ